MTTTETTASKFAGILDGEECTGKFSVWLGEVPADMAKADTNEAARLFTHTILACDSVPMEGSTGESLRFQDELSGLGFTVTWATGEPGADGFVWVRDVHVYRDSTWDRTDGDPRPVPYEVGDECDELFEDIPAAGPAIAFDTCEEYEAQCERCTQAGVDRAAREVWDALKAEAEEFWGFEERLRDRGRVDAAKRHMRTFKAKLDTYERVFAALGAQLVVSTDWADPTERVWEIKVHGTDSVWVSGCLRCWGKANW